MTKKKGGEGINKLKSLKKYDSKRFRSNSSLRFCFQLKPEMKRGYPGFENPLEIDSPPTPFSMEEEKNFSFKPSRYCKEQRNLRFVFRFQLLSCCMFYK